MEKTQITNASEVFMITPDLREAEALNRILRGEISAVEAYQQILEKIEDDPDKTKIQMFLDFHEDLVKLWTSKVEEKGIKPDSSSGMWGAVVEAFVGTAKLFGDNRTIDAIIQGEEHGLSEYKNLVKNKHVSEDIKLHVKKTVIPSLELHINTFKALKEIH